jgi:hypothetical protein
LSYALFQISIEGESEFSRRSRFYKAATTEISATTNPKTKGSAAGSPFLVTVLAKQKSESRRGAPFHGTRSVGAGTVQRVAAIN